MKLTNTVYRYAIRKLKVGTASVAVAALMFLGSGNAVVNAADLNQQSALVAKSSSPEITQVKEASPTEDNLKTDLEVDTKALEADKSPETDLDVTEDLPKTEAESVASDLTKLEESEGHASQDEPKQEVSAEDLSSEATEAKASVDEASASSEESAPSVKEAEATVANQVAAANAANQLEEVKPLANANSAAENRIILPPGFTPSLFEPGAYSASHIDAIAKPGRALNTYKSNEADKKEIVDVTNLTEAQRKELSLFVANLINPIRQQFGKEPYKVNAGSVNAAQKVANAYKEDNWYAWTRSHDTNATSRALANVANGWGENLATINPNTTTMDDLKKQFHYQTVWMLFDDSHANFGHARNFLLFENPYGNHDVYLGISTNRAGASDAKSFGTQYYTMFAPKDGSSEFTPGNDYTSDPTPSQPSQPTTPSQPSQPTTPSQPSQPTTPSQPSQPTTPSQPSQPTTPSQPSQPTTPSQPSQPTTPSQPSQPTTPSQPSQPTTPSQPSQPTTPSQPSQPTTPSQPSQPSQPTTPSQPSQPTTPSQPSQPTTPSQPSQPTTPSQPSQPMTPSQPSQPTTPSQPSQPTTPGQPSQPTTPSQPSQESDLAADRLGQANASDPNKPSEMAPKDNGQSPVEQALPNTGESSNLLALGAAIMTAIAGIALLVFKRRKI